MDKQIIIDGVDVTQCGFFSKVEGKQTNVCYIMPCHELETEKFIGYLGCSENLNCYYKQLKKAMNQIVDLNKKVETKEQECEKLKEELQKYKDNEQQEKEIQKLYNKFEGSSLIDYKNKRGGQ
jgi:predicted RNase H-like nuclease (RuvC/YqgF family)